MIDRDKDPYEMDPEDYFYQKEMDNFYREKEMNTSRPGQKWAPADFLYDPIKDHEENFS